MNISLGLIAETESINFPHSAILIFVNVAAFNLCLHYTKRQYHRYKKERMDGKTR